ncbi:MAG: signal transduction histidine kinase [Bacteriovoracaceae bacterium]|jgi:signal transduction histidine kinase
MKLYVTLIFTAVGIAFTLGYFALFIQGSNVATQEEIMEINAIKTEFQRRVAPQSIVNFNSLYFSPEQFKLLDPANTLPEPGTDNSILYSTTKNCFKGFTKLINTENFEKVWVWEEFRCGGKSYLPPSFFTDPPYMHPSGKSFAFLAYNLKKGGYDSKKWVKNHLSYFHTMELRQLRYEVGELGGIYSILEKLDEEALSDLGKGQGSILTRDYLFARLRYPKIFNILEYRIYLKDDLDNFLESSPYSLQNYRSNRTCFHKDGELCWNYNVRHIFRMANTSTLGVFIGLFIMIIVSVRLLLVKIKGQRLEDDRRRLALQVLTHEFRTPITSMLLTIERLNKNYEKLDEQTQEGFLRLSSEVYRMQRLTETSRNYLKAQQSKELINFNFEPVESINIFFEDLLGPYEERLPGDFTVSYLEKDANLCTDTYWVHICVKNLVENAITHGTLPIHVELKMEGEDLFVKVGDRGVCDFDDLGELTREFVKGNKSSGTGLGLNIVKKVVKEMQGQMLFVPNPTTFTISFKNQKTGVENG